MNKKGKHNLQRKVKRKKLTYAHSVRKVIKGTLITDPEKLARHQALMRNQYNM
jgi:hypothetical protein